MLSLFSDYFQTVTHDGAGLFLFWITFLPQKLLKTDVTDRMPRGKEGFFMLMKNSVSFFTVLKKKPNPKPTKPAPYCFGLVKMS